ncbi:oxidoreductase-like protein [Bisporella sp. PMI_857]|nr:oxidoreductase-like protein [Bisporella sp. PMI_857]
MSPGPEETASRAAALEVQDYLSSRIANKSSTPSFRSIPIIDLAPSFSSSLTTRKEVARKIYDACITSGFFYITNHGLESVCSSTLTLAKRFFDELSPEEKESIHMRKSKYFRGYEPPDYTTVNGIDEQGKETKEAFNWGYEAGLEEDGEGDGAYVELDGSPPDPKANLWPDESALPGFYAGIKEHYSKMLRLCRHLFKLFALSLDLPETYFEPLTTHPGAIGRLIRYPASSSASASRANDEEELGLGAHTDYECFTLLVQSPTPGLEVLSPDGRWIVAAPVPGSIVVNVADFLMRWTNGVYRSTVHRVVNRTAEERFSVPLFFSINYDARVETLRSCVSEENPSRFPPITAGRYVLDRLSLTVDGKY